jgi:hypothetical protein
MTLPARALLAYPNYTTPQYAAAVSSVVSVVTPTFSRGSWAAGLPLTNLLYGEPRHPARSTDATAANTQFQIDLGAVRPLQAFALIGHNLTPALDGSAQWRVRVSNDATFATALYDSGFVNAFQPFWAPTSLPIGWSPGAFTGAPTAADLAHYPRLVAPIFADTIQLARYVRVEIVDTANAAGFVQIGTFFCGPAYVPAINHAYGAQLGWRSTTKVSTGELGSRYYQAGVQYRIAQFAYDALTLDQGLEFPFEMDAALGLDQKLLFCADPTTANHLQRWTMLANQEELSPLEFPYLNTATKAVKLIEVI